MEQGSGRIPFRAERTAEGHTRVLELLRERASGHDDEYSRAMLTDAAGYYGQVEAWSDEANAMNRALVEHGIRTDDPDLVEAVLPQVRPYERYGLVADAMNAVQREAERFEHITDDRVRAWWPVVGWPELHQVAEQDGALSVVRTLLSELNATLAVQIGRVQSPRELQEAYLLTVGRFRDILDRAHQGNLFTVDAEDPSRSDDYVGERMELAHLAGSIGETDPLVFELPQLEPKAIYQGRAGKFRTQALGRLRSEWQKEGAEAYYRLIARVALATQGRWHYTSDPVLAEAQALADAYLPEVAGTGRLSGGVLGTYLGNASRALRSTYPGLLHTFIRAADTQFYEITGPEVLDDMLAAGRTDVASALDHYYFQQVHRNNLPRMFWSALYGATHGSALRSTDRDEEAAEVMGQVGNINSRLATLRSEHGAPEEELQRQAMLLYDQVARLPEQYSDQVVAAALTILESLHHLRVLSFTNSKKVVDAMHPRVLDLQKRRSQDEASRRIFATITRILTSIGDIEDSLPIDKIEDLRLGQTKGIDTVDLGGNPYL